MLLVVPALATAHTVLRKSEPANGAVLQAVPRALRLTFSEAPNLGFTTLELVGADSQRVELSALRTASSDSARVVVADVLGRLTAGEYHIRWRITSADGHPVRGTVSFRIAEDAAGLVAEAPPPVVESLTSEDVQAGMEEEFDAGSWPYALIRLATFTALLIVIGSVVFALVIVPATHHRLPDLAPSFAIETRQRAARFGLVATLVLPVVLIARVIAQSMAVMGTMPTAEFLSIMADTTWGIGAGLHLVAIAIVIAALARARRASWRIASLGVVLLCISTALWGHAAAAGEWRALVVANDTAHMLAAGGWLGTLLIILVVGLPVALISSGGGDAVRALVNAFSPMALSFAAIIVLTGIISATLRLGTWGDLIHSDYGRVLMLKVSLLGLTIVAGAYNWLRVRPRLDAQRVPVLQRSATAELALGLAILAVTAWLVATPPPTS
jgi:putative copper export protein/methionine-rich copper-binding protein CopC